MNWLPIAGYEDLYEVSDTGEVRSLDRIVIYSTGKRRYYRGQLLKPNLIKGYKCVTLCKPGSKRIHKIHRLVLQTFRPTNDDSLMVCHNNGDQTDNLLSNLRWGTASDNNYDKVRHGTHDKANRTKCPRGHALTKGNTIIRRANKRGCQACSRAQAYVRNCNPGIDAGVLSDLCYEHNEVPSKAILRYDR